MQKWEGKWIKIKVSREICMTNYQSNSEYKVPENINAMTDGGKENKD